MGNSASQTITLQDGTQVGDASTEGQAFAKAISRMHCILKGCDAEFANLSEMANLHGSDSEQYAAAARKLAACQRRRAEGFHAIETHCGPAQGGYGDCIREKGAERSIECLPVLQSFLDCAERTLERRRT